MAINRQIHLQARNVSRRNLPDTYGKISLTPRCAPSAPPALARPRKFHAQYQIQSEAERAALDSHWRARVAASDELMQAWRWHYARYEQRIRQRQGS